VADPPIAFLVIGVELVESSCTRRMRLSAHDEGDAWEVEKRLEWQGLSTSARIEPREVSAVGLGSEASSHLCKFAQHLFAGFDISNLSS